MNKANAPQHETPSLSGSPWCVVFSLLDFDIEFFEQIFARDKTSTEVVRVLSELVAKKGQLDRAVKLDRHLVNLLPEDALARYNLGCSLARAGCSKEAISSLSQAILLGYDDLHHLEVDPDLDSLRDHPDFQNLLDED